MNSPTGSLAPGDLLADRYRITGPLGAGGMALVYRAEDLRHQRAVAVKVLQPEGGAELAAERFTQEIRTTATLQHPHIVPVFDSGSFGEQHFYVMPLIEGESLKDRLGRGGALEVAEAVRIVREIASALDHAHARGILHRDLKPANVLLSQGHAMLADFGIAHLMDVTDDDRMTRTGTSLGTPAYMSPEQATGAETLGPPSDVYALGAICFELLAGAPPFTGPTPEAVLIKRFTEDAPTLTAVRPGIPDRIAAAVGRALARDPGERFASAGAFAAALGSGPGVEREPSAQGVAVLPFTNGSASADDQYFADGLSEEITLLLTRLRSLRVIARTTMQSYRGRGDAVEAAGRELGVAHVLEGSVRRAGNRLRVTAALIRTADQFTVWSERFDGTMEDVFAVQDTIASAVLDALSVVLAPEQRQALHERPQISPADYDLHLKAQYEIGRATPTSIINAMALLEEALKRTPNQPLLLRGLAIARWQAVNLGVAGDRAATLRAALDCARRIEAIEPGSPYAAEVRGMVAVFEGELHRGWRELAAAYEALGAEGDAGLWFAMTCMFTGHHDIGLAVSEDGLARDPAHPLSWCIPVMIHQYAGRFDKALVAASDPPAAAAPPLVAMVRGMSELGRGDRDAAHAALVPALTPLPAPDAWSAMVAILVAGIRGDRSMLEAALTPDQVENARGDVQNAEVIAEAFLLLGDVDAAAEWLNYSATQGFGLHQYIVRDHALWRPHAADPRLSPLLATIRANAARAAQLVVPPRIQALAKARQASSAEVSHADGVAT